MEKSGPSTLIPEEKPSSEAEGSERFFVDGGDVTEIRGLERLGELAPEDGAAVDTGYSPGGASGLYGLLTCTR